MKGMCGVDSPQHDLWDLTLYRHFDKDKDRSRKPLYPHINKCLVTGVLFRSDCAETCLAENIKTGKPAIISYLIPKVEFDCLSQEHNNFQKVGALLAKKRGIRFLPEGQIKRASCQLRGFSVRIFGESAIAEYRCISCDRKISDENISNLRSPNDSYSCDCGNEIRLKHINITVPVLIQRYKDHISLKRALINVRTNNLAIPNLIFCWLISVTAKYLIRIVSQPILISSQAVMLCADGTSMYLYTPVGQEPAKLRRHEIPQHIAKFFEPMLSSSPDKSTELTKFMALPNAKTLRNVRQLGKAVTRTHVHDWLKYVVASRNKEGSESYQPVQAMIASELEKKKISLEQTLSPTDKDLHRGKVSLSELQQIQTAQERNRKSLEEKGERKKNWQKYLEEPELSKSSVAHLLLLLKRIPLWQKYAFAGAASVVILFLVLFSMASIKSPKTRIFSDDRAVLKSSPARLLKESISNELQEKIGNTVATAQILISVDGRVEKIEWVYVTNEQRKTYASVLKYLKFQPAKQNGVATESWQTIQLPLKPRAEK
jgi:hypothetical protein